MISRPYLLFLGDASTEPMAKTAFGIRDWLPAEVVGQLRLPGCGVDLGLSDVSPRQAWALGAKSMLLGVAPIGGGIPEAWIPTLIEALEAGLDLVSGMHTRLGDLGAVQETAERLGRVLHDVRHVDQRFSVASGRRRRGKRLLTVGTDCALGKKYTALAIAKALQARGAAADFRATGQTGIMIAGRGVPIDAVVADFIAGAAESLSPPAPEDHWDVIEGQGSLFHPAYAGVCLGLLHGSQPDALILCHDPHRTTLHGFPDYALPPVQAALTRYLEAAKLTNPSVRFFGVSLNTSKMTWRAAGELFEALEATHGLRCIDPIRSDLNPLVDDLLALTAPETRTGA